MKDLKIKVTCENVEEAKRQVKEFAEACDLASDALERLQRSLDFLQGNN